MSENKTVFEQLEEVQKELKDLKEKQKTLVDQLNEDDPKIIEFVKRANRVWRYSYEKSDLPCSPQYPVNAASPTVVITVPSLLFPGRDI